jgi:DNA-binding Lrp family transcriptional regulator
MRKKVSGPSLAQMRKIRAVVEKNSPQMIHSIANEVGIEPGKILYGLLRLEEAGVLKINLIIYHRCAEGDNVVIYKGDFRDGFPIPPFECAECDEDVTEPEDLAFDIEAVADGKVPVA